MVLFEIAFHSFFVLFSLVLLVASVFLVATVISAIPDFAEMIDDARRAINRSRGKKK